MKYFLKDLQPNLLSGISWSNEMKKLLAKVCQSEELLVKAIFDENDLVTLYVEDSELKVFRICSNPMKCYKLH